MLAVRRPGWRGYAGIPDIQGTRGVAPCPAPQQALGLQPAGSGALPWIRTGEEGGRPSGQPYVNPGAGWVGGEGGSEEGEVNLFGWSGVRVSRFPYPGIAGGAAIGSEDHVGP